MTDPQRFLSHAQNGEDVVLWRALGHIEKGVYIDVGANDPSTDSVSRSFYDHGWSGIAIEPNPEYAARFRSERPRDSVIEAVVSDSEDDEIVLHMIAGTGLSTIVDNIRVAHAENGYNSQDVLVPSRRLDEVIQSTGLDRGEIHFMSVDTEGAEASVLRSLDFSKYRPWVLIVESTAPQSTRRTHAEWEPALLASGYTFCLFDGLSRYYVANERRDKLLEALDYPAGVFDDFTTVAAVRVEDEVRSLQQTIEQQRESIAKQVERTSQVSAELERVRNTISWQITRPLRSVRSILRKEGGAE